MTAAATTKQPNANCADHGWSPSMTDTIAVMQIATDVANPLRMLSAYLSWEVGGDHESVS